MFWIWWQHGYDDKTFSGKVRRLLHHHQRLCSRQNSQVWKCYLDHGMRRYWRPSSTYPLIYTKTATQMEVTLDKAPRFSIRRVIWILLSDTICQLIQFYTNSEAALLPNLEMWLNLSWVRDYPKLEKDPLFLPSCPSQREKRPSHTSPFLPSAYKSSGH